MTSPLFTSVQVGPLTLAHRVVLAPLTRMRAEFPGGVPGAAMAQYYAQRTSPGGLLIAEATAVSPVANAYLGAPGLYTAAQVAGWRRVTDAVHAQGGRIISQLWHAGRQAHVELTGGVTPVAPSVVPYESAAFTSQGWGQASPPRALATEEIAGVVAAYRQAAAFAQAAGFDGVELHAANGYLPEQFLQSGSNTRTDRYGGSAENRARFLLEVTAELVAVWGADRVGVRISPSGTFNAMSDANPKETFGYVATALAPLGLAYLHVIEPRIKGSTLTSEGAQPIAAAWLKPLFRGTIIAAGGFEPDSAQAIVAGGEADLVAFGRHFIANPDLPQRIEQGLPLNPYDRTTFYGGTERGYTDYPTYAETSAAAKAAAA